MRHSQNGIHLSSISNLANFDNTSENIIVSISSKLCTTIVAPLPLPPPENFCYTKCEWISQYLVRIKFNLQNNVSVEKMFSGNQIVAHPRFVSVCKILTSRIHWTSRTCAASMLNNKSSLGFPKFLTLSINGHVYFMSRWEVLKNNMCRIWAPRTH